MKRHVITLLTLAFCCLATSAAEKNLPIKGEVFEVEGHTAFLILPAKTKTVSGKAIPWLWYAPTLPRLPGKEESWMFEKFLKNGIAIAGIDVGESYGSPAGRALYSALHQELVEKRGLSKQACLLARSRGGLMLYSWAAEHPELVACIAGIYPVCNLTSYPGLAKACGAYGLTIGELTQQLSAHNPIDRLAALAGRKVPIFHIHGDMDTVVPLEKNSGIVAERYEELGGDMTLQVVKGQGHNMWKGWFECQELVDFVIAHSGAKNAEAEAVIRALGGLVFSKVGSGEVTGVRLNGAKKLRDADLARLAEYTGLTDLSLEETAVTGAGMAHFVTLKKLEWLNLWQTGIDDEGLAHLANLPALQALPIGGTKVTDAGLLHLKELKQLSYLGLRDTAISDAGVSTLAAFPALKEVNLRGTRVTDECLVDLIKIKALRKVWLGGTAVTEGGIARLRKARPECAIDLEE